DHPTEPGGHGRRLSRRGAALASARATITPTGPPRPFRAGVPGLSEVPVDRWARLIARRLRAPAAELFAYGDPAGYRPLREAIAEHLRVARAARCTADQVIVVAGSQQGLDLAARLLLDPGDTVWFEDPGYLGARGAFEAAGARLMPVPVDAE